MVKKFATRLLLILAVTCAAPLALAADPSVSEVYQAARSGHIAQAEQMIDQVLRDHPNSSKAHFVAAEVYAHGHDFARAREELSKAQSIQPGLPKENPTAVRELEQQLAQGSGTMRVVPYAAPQRHSSFPWMPVIILVLVVGVLWAIFSRRNAAAANTYPQYTGAGPGGPVPGPMGTPGVGYPGGPVVGGGGSGIMGSLATGLAVGAGVAAGEELVRHVLEPGREGYVPPPPEYVEPPPVNSDMGGDNFGVSDPGSWDDGGSSFGGDSGGGDDWT